MNKEWTRFVDRYPTSNDCPFWVFDNEFESLELIKNINERIFARQWCIKSDLVWQKADFIRPILPQPERLNPETHCKMRCDSLNTANK